MAAGLRAGEWVRYCPPKRRRNQDPAGRIWLHLERVVERLPGGYLRVQCLNYVGDEYYTFDAHCCNFIRTIPTEEEEFKWCLARLK